MVSLNPEFLADRIAFTNHRQANIDCRVETKLGKDADAETTLRKGGFLAVFKSKPLKIAKLAIGKALVTDSSSPKETIVRHEFLHFLSFDNFPVTAHNDGDIVYSEGAAYFDTVYSCSVAAFPVENAFYRGGFVAKFNIQTDRMAQTCTAARAHGSKVTVDVSDLPFLNTRLKGSVACYLFTKTPKRDEKAKLNRRDVWPWVADVCQN